MRKQGERAKEQKEHRVASATQNQEELKKPRGFREVQILVGRVLAWTSGLEMVLSGWDCGYSIWIGIYEYAGLLVIGWSMLVVFYWCQAVNRKYTNTEYWREERVVLRMYATIQARCQFCGNNQVIRFVCQGCRVCIHCSSAIILHSQLLDMCLNKEKMSFYNKIFIFAIFKSLYFFGYRIYSLFQAPNHPEHYFQQVWSRYEQIFLGVSLCGLLLELLLLPLYFYLLIRFSAEKRQNRPKPQMPDIQPEQNHQTQPPPPVVPVQTVNTKRVFRIPMEQNESNISIEQINVARLASQRSSISPSPGRYRSGKILDFLEKKLSHARSQSSLGASKKKIYITDQIVDPNQSIEIESDSEDSGRVSEKMRYLRKSTIKMLPS